ncbi:hypothetical protein GCM10009613_40320 [Pseudonocardia kongjuensis]|uniref:HIT domain-containing protein n=1 Tax=Pseudonocardia kongjuensis TaxID=102227 RepID=A0ABP4IRS1_9PSEU
MVEDCLICAKHEGRGPLVAPVAWTTEEFVVTHHAPAADGLGFVGYLLVEPRRHVATWDLLTITEVQGMATAAWLAARALRRLLDVEGVFTAIIGRQVPHVHQHVFVRHAGTPADLRWDESPDWSGAPTRTLGGLEEFARQVRHAAGTT